jgi:hypothetical protein
MSFQAPTRISHQAERIALQDFPKTFVTATIRRQATRPANGVCASASALKALTLGFYISKAMLG